MCKYFQLLLLCLHYLISISSEFDENSENFKLEVIVEMNFQKYDEEIVDISNAATMELQIENGIKNIREIWRTMKIEIISFKENIYRIKNVDDCQTALEVSSNFKIFS